MEATSKGGGGGETATTPAERPGGFVAEGATALDILMAEIARLCGEISQAAICLMAIDTRSAEKGSA